MGFVCEESKCAACFACINICPKGCLSMRQNKYGNIVPYVNTDDCINCNLCKRICPVNNPIELRLPHDVYAAYATDEQIHKESASGGIATVLASSFLKNGGIVYGSVMERGLKCRHIRIDSVDDLCKLQKSKYVHSHIDYIFRDIKKLLQHEVNVIFIGTPCQVAGLRNFLSNTDDSNLYCIDLICHGVPSWNTLYQSMMLETGMENFENSILSFRDKDGFEIKIRDNTGNILSRLNLKNSLYYNGFMEGYIYRENCYECPYATQKRIGDVTLGDFWGLGKIIPFDEKVNNGINVVLVNTSKGQKIIEEVIPFIKVWRRSLEEAVQGNGQLRHPANKSKELERFLRYSAKFGIKYAMIMCNPKKTIKLQMRKYINKSRICNGILSQIPKIKDKL